MKGGKCSVLILALGLPYALYAQGSLGSDPLTHFIKHTLFVCRDTAYELTRVLSDEFGGISFRRGFRQPEDFRFHGMATLTYPVKSQSTSTHIIRYELLPGVDTLLSCFSSCQIPTQTTFSRGNAVYIEDLLTEEAFLAHSIRALGILHLDTSTVYYFGRVDDGPNRMGDRYVLYSIENWRSTSPRVWYVLGRTSPNGFESLDSNVLHVNTREMRRIRRQVVEFANSDWPSCVAPGERGTARLLTVLGKRVIMTDACSATRFRRRSPEALLGIPATLAKYSRIK